MPGTKGVLEEIANRAVRLAVERGADGAECTVYEGEEFETTVRMGETEVVKESGSRGAGLRVLFGKRSGSSYSSDLTEDGVRALVGQAVDIASITTDDPHAGLPEPEELGSLEGDLQLYHEDIRLLAAAEKIDLARRAEKAALDADPRITNSEGGNFNSNAGEHAFASSGGFSAAYRTSTCSLSAVPVAKNGDRMERDFWYSVARKAGGLEAPELIGRKAAERALRRLGARKVPTQRVAVVFEPRAARSLVGHVFEAVHGEAVYRKASIYAGRLGEQVASESFTVIDDGTLPGLFGSSPFDDEGVPTRRTTVIDKGVLGSYLLNTYTARKLGLKTTGNASRGITGNAGVGHGNLFLPAGVSSVDEILRQVGTGLYVTELIGFGVNIVTGDYSRGAAGLWIENGELAFPVSEVTIAGNLKDMFRNVVAVGNDLEFRGSVAAPTIAVEGLTVSGQ